MLRRLLKSRGWAKFRRDRRAMVSLVVIALYGLLALYIIGAEVVEGIGRRTGAFTLRGTPAGMFLPIETLTRVGPETMAGFGLEQDPDLRVVQHGWYIQELGRALAEVDRLGGAGDAREVLDRFAVAERRIADVPLERLRELHAQGEALLARRDELAIRRTALRNAAIKAAAVEPAAAALREAVAESPDDPARLKQARERLAFALEDLAYAVEDVAVQGEPETELAQLDVEPLLERSEGLLEAEEGAAIEEPLYPEEMVERVERLARASAEGVLAELGQVVAQIEPVVDQAYPIPEGFDGWVYRFKVLLGTDKQGRSILVRALYSAKVAIQVGFVTAVVSVLIGSLLGAAAAFFGGWVDHAVNWLFSVLSSIPHLVLLVVIAFMFTGTAVDGTLVPVYAAFCLTFWIGACRVVRGEAIKIKELEYVQAATAIGFDRFYILARHVIPNTLHLMFISFSLLFIAAIKSEVILTFLGLGLKEGASWGIMISQSKAEVVSGFFWQIGAATFFMFVLVLAFNIVSDALQDAFDPRHVG